MSRLVLIPALLAAACTDFATPNQLEKPTIVAVVSDPPIVPPGGTAALSVVLADASGVVMAPPSAWALVEAYPGMAPLASWGWTCPCYSGVPL